MGELTRKAMGKLGRRILQAREALGLSQVAISHVLGYTCDTYISKVENGQKTLPLRKIEILAETLKIPIGELIDLSMEIHRAKYYDSISGAHREDLGQAV